MIRHVSENIDVISDYLRGQVERISPGSQPRVSFQDEDPGPLFIVSYLRPGPAGSDHDGTLPLERLMDKLERIFPNSEVYPRPHDDDKRLAFVVKGNPTRLVSDIRAHDPLEAPPPPKIIM